MLIEVHQGIGIEQLLQQSAALNQSTRGRRFLTAQKNPREVPLPETLQSSFDRLGGDHVKLIAKLLDQRRHAVQTTAKQQNLRHCRHSRISARTRNELGSLYTPTRERSQFLCERSG